MSHLIQGFITFIFAAIIFIIMAYIVTPTIITGTDTGSMVVKSFFLLILAGFVIAVPLIVLVRWWHSHDEPKV
jgi:hypothetical protein